MNDFETTPVTPEPQNLLAVVSFGPVGLSKGAFHGARQLNAMPLRDIPDASKLKNLSAAFTRNVIFNASIEH